MEPAAPLTKKGAGNYMDPFLSIGASTFPGRAIILYSNLKVHAKNTKFGKLQEKVK
jgi:hypothetical protein